jgi:hypothetical protein
MIRQAAAFRLRVCRGSTTRSTASSDSVTTRRGGFLRRQRTLQTQPIDRPQRFDRQKLARNQGLVGAEILDRAGLAKHQGRQQTGSAIARLRPGAGPCLGAA